MEERKNFDTARLNRIAKELVEREFGEKVLSISAPFEFGYENYSILVHTKHNRIVVRLNPEDGIEPFRKEAWAIKLAIQAGIPTPAPVYLGEVESVAVSIFPYIASQNGLLHPDKALIWRQIGDYARRLHQIQVIGYGEHVVNENSHHFSDTWQRYVQYNIQSLSKQDKLLEMGVLNAQSSQRLQDTFIRLSQTNFQFGLSHGDLSEKNTIIDPDAKVWLIDWACVEAQITPHFDITGILEWNIAASSPEFASFLQGYGMSQEEFAAIASEIDDFSLLQATDKLRWAVDRSPENIEKFAQGLTEKLRRIRIID